MTGSEFVKIFKAFLLKMCLPLAGRDMFIRASTQSEFTNTELR
jgi:hypothetical protein